MNYEAMTDRELDALVAEKVLRVDDEEAAKTWWPSTNVSDAFEVVKAMRERGYEWQIDSANSVWVAYVGKRGEAEQFGKQDKSLPRAICLAALRALDA